MGPLAMLQQGLGKLENYAGTIPNLNPPSSRGDNRGSGSWLKVPRGQFTFDLEGRENPGGHFHSRSASIPADGSGVTVGRGFDLGQFDTQQIQHILTRAGFDSSFIESAKGAALLEGEAARNYLRQIPLREISLEEQWRLFNETRQFMERDVRRIVAKPDTVAAYGVLNLDSLSRVIQDLVIDLRFRGDFTGETRKILQPLLVENDLLGIIEALSNKTYWVDQQGVPLKRFNARISLIRSQLE